MSAKLKIYDMENPMTREQYAALFEIMEYSFPACERRNFDEQFAEFQRIPFRSMVLEDSENPLKILGFMNYWELSGFVYLEHFAVAREFRRHGIGGQLMKRLRETHDIPVILEVEPPETSDYAVRRIKFYENLGFFANDYEYYQPPYRADEVPVRLILMSNGKPLSPEEFVRVRDVIYSDAYESDSAFLTSL